MLKMKKALSLLLVGAFAATTVLSGCGSSNEATSASTTAGSSTVAVSTGSETSTSELKPYEINWYMLGNGQPKDTADVEAAINKIIQPKINATINFNVISWADWDTKTGTMIAASDAFDMIFTASWMKYIDFKTKGAIIPLDDLMSKYAKETTDLIGKQALDTVRIDGKVWGVPVIKDYSGYQGLLFNKKYMDKYGWDINSIKTLADIEPWLKTIKEKEPGIIPLEIDGTNSFFDYMSELKVGQFSGDGNVTLGMYFDGRDAKVHNVYETQDGIDMLNLTRKFYQAGYIRKDAALENTKHNDNINNGTVFCDPSLLKPGKDGEMSNPKITFVQKGLQDTYMYDAMGAMVSLSKTSQDPERCMMFLNMLYQSKELTNLIHYGVEGKDYTKKSDTVIEPIKDNGWQLNMQWAIGNQFIQYLTSADDPQKFEKIEQMNKEAKSCLFNGFIFNKDSLTAEYAAVVNATKQYRNALNVGAIDPATNVQKLLDAQKKAGIDKIKDEMQKQFDAFAATKK